MTHTRLLAFKIAASTETFGLYSLYVIVMFVIMGFPSTTATGSIMVCLELCFNEFSSSISATIRESHSLTKHYFTKGRVVYTR